MPDGTGQGVSNECSRVLTHPEPCGDGCLPVLVSAAPLSAACCVRCSAACRKLLVVHCLLSALCYPSCMSVVHCVQCAQFEGLAVAGVRSRTCLRSLCCVFRMACHLLVSSLRVVCAVLSMSSSWSRNCTWPGLAYLGLDACRAVLQPLVGP